MQHTLVTVREHARLTHTPLIEPSGKTLDRACIPKSAFDWLCQQAGIWRRSGAQLLQVEDQRWLKLDGFVGTLQTPCGLQLEILPKHVDACDENTIKQARQLMLRLLSSALDLPTRDAGPADLQQQDQPLTEWVIGRFLRGLEQVMQRGLRQEYHRIDDEQPFLRGQLDVTRQMRQSPGRAHRFPIRHDVFDPDRAENRLLKAALLRARDATHHAGHWRLASELLHRLVEVPTSRDPSAEWSLWRTDRLMAHYQPVRPWCELVLGRQMPLAMAGATHGLSLLFPMARLFEQHVASTLRRKLPAGLQLRAQVRRHALCEHLGEQMFELQPDLLIEPSTGGAPVAVLDTKWKRLDGAKGYGLAQSDFYQMHAYGQTYLGGSGNLVLIYPQTQHFAKPLPEFRFNERLRLTVVPFNLDNDEVLWGADLYETVTAA